MQIEKNIEAHGGFMKVKTQPRFIYPKSTYISILSQLSVFILPAHSREIDSPFQDLKLGYSSDKVSQIVGRLLPKTCSQKHEEIKFENQEGYFSIYFDERGRLSQVERTQKKVAKADPDAAFRAIANKYKCDNFAMTLSIGSNNSIQYVKSGSVSQKNSSFYEKRKLGILQLNLNGNSNKDRNYSSICKIKNEFDANDVQSLCILNVLFCPSEPKVGFGGSRF